MPDDVTNAPVPAPATELPAPLDRAAIERVLARAAELQALQTDAPEGLSDPQLVSLGQEVGIAPEHIRQALAEERTRVAIPSEPGWSGSWYGASTISASRVVHGTPASVLAALDQWMQREELLRPRRRYSERLTWEARSDFLGSIQAGFNLRGRPYSLTSASEVGATAVEVDADRVLVRLDADFGGSRRRSLRGSAVAAGTGVLAGAGVAAFASMAPEFAGVVIGSAIGLVSALLGGGVAAAVAAAQRRRVTRGQLAIEQVLDRLEHGTIRPGRNPLVDFLAPGR
jgi:hypothetical protein